MTDQLDDLLEEYHTLLTRRNIDDDVKQWSIGKVEEIQPYIDLMKEDRSYERFLAGYLAEESEKERQEPLCHCRNSLCPVLNGDLPKDISNADDVEQGEYEFTREHRGDPVGLREARQEHRRINTAVMSTLRTVIASLSSNQKQSVDSDLPELNGFY